MTSDAVGPPTDSPEPPRPSWWPDNGTWPPKTVPECAACGSLDIYHDPTDGWSCRSCHRTDADE